MWTVEPKFRPVIIPLLSIDLKGYVKMQYMLKLLLLSIPVIVFLFYFSHAKTKLASILMGFFLLAILTNFILHVGKETYENYHQPPVWDFQVFWLNGRVADQGLNFYKPENYRKLAETLKPDDAFTQEILNVGFWYPPMTMFLFSLLGRLDISTAYLVWQISILITSAVCVFELWGLLPKEKKILSLLLVSVLMFRLSPAHTTFHGSQTNFIVLLFFLIFWRNRSKDWSGIWLAFAVIVKPYMALLYIYPLFAKKWKMLTIAISALATLTFLSIIVFGWDVFVSFFVENPTSKLPVLAYTEEVNQSLLSMILRFNPRQVISESPLLNPLYLGVSSLLTLITIWVATMKKNNDDWVILSILFLALIVYPASLEHYSVFLIIPVVLLLQQSGQSIKQRATVFLIIFATYFLSSYDFDGHMFFANVFMWLICILFGLRSSLDMFMDTIVTQSPYFRELSLYRD